MEEKIKILRKQLIGKKMSMLKLSQFLIDSDFSDIFDIGNLDECIRYNKCVSVGYNPSIYTDIKEIDIEFEVINYSNDILEVEVQIYSVFEL